MGAAAVEVLAVVVTAAVEAAAAAELLRLWLRPRWPPRLKLPPPPPLLLLLRRRLLSLLLLPLLLLLHDAPRWYWSSCASKQGAAQRVRQQKRTRKHKALPFALPVENSHAEKGGACAQCIMEASGGARRINSSSSVKKNHDTLVVLSIEKCACVAQCVVQASCSGQFARCVSGVDVDCAVRSQSRAERRVCQSRRCALPRRWRRWRACDFVGGSF